MTYMQIPVSDIEPNPFQIRETENEAIAGIVTTIANSSLGVLSPPLVRPHPTKSGKYQTSFGHGRVRAVKILEYKTIECRVEDLTDSDMKKYVLIENINRDNLSESEIMNGLEAVRIAEGLKKTNVAELSRKTGLSEKRISERYDVNTIRSVLAKSSPGEDLKLTYTHIRDTSFLIGDRRIKYLIKIAKMGVSTTSMREMNKAIRKMDDEIKEIVVSSELPKETIIKLAEVEDSEVQKAIIKQIEVRHLNQKDSLKLIRRVINGKVVEEAKVLNEYEELLKATRKSVQNIKTWGFAQYGILGEKGWAIACEYFSEIEAHMVWLKTKGWTRE